MSFRVTLDEYWTATIDVMNATDSGKPANECFVCELYLPVNQDMTQDVLSLGFPLDITEEELLAALGDPDETDEYVSDDSDYHKETYEWVKESEIYIGDSNYRFEFINDELAYFYIEYTP